MTRPRKIFDAIGTGLPVSQTSFESGSLVKEERRREFGAEEGTGELVRPAGFEPAAFGSGGRRSIQLSYGRV